MNTGTWAGSALPCGVCGATYYCLGGASNARMICPNGTFGRPTDITLSTAACSGACTRGYFCPAGSTVSTFQECGSVAVYCPAGTTLILTVPPGFYSGPLIAPPTQRYQSLPCPAARQCAGGVILPGINFEASSMCTVGVRTAASLAPTASNTVFFTATVAVPGIASPAIGNVVWTTTKIEANTPACMVPVDRVSWLTPSALVGQLRWGATPLDIVNCLQGFTVSLSARRVDSGEVVTCSVPVVVAEPILPPTITDCTPRAVTEGQARGVAVGAPLTGTNANTGTSLRWFMQSNPFYDIDTCTGQVQTTASLTFASMAAAGQGTLSLQVNLTNDGSKMGLVPPTVTVSCMLSVSVRRIVFPPVVTATVFYPLGACMGMAVALLRARLASPRWLARSSLLPHPSALSPALRVARVVCRLGARSHAGRRRHGE